MMFYHTSVHLNGGKIDGCQEKTMVVSFSVDDVVVCLMVFQTDNKCLILVPN